MLGGGKRLRPAFAYWGYRGAGGVDSDAGGRGRLRAGAGAGQRADPRRPDGPLRHPARRAGRAPAVRRPAHRGGLARRRGGVRRQRRDPARRPGLVWSDELLHTGRAWTWPTWPGPGRSSTRCAPRSPSGSTWTCTTQATGDTSVERAGKVARYKSAKYTVERPLLLGAALAGAARDAGPGVLGVRPAAGRGVPAARRRARRLRRPGADRQAGRRRPARGQAHLPGRGRVRRRADRPSRPSWTGGWATRPWTTPAWPGCATIISASGALARTEERIADAHRPALSALAAAKIEPEARTVLEHLAEAATHRSVSPGLRRGPDQLVFDRSRSCAEPRSPHRRPASAAPPGGPSHTQIDRLSSTSANPNTRSSTGA